MSKTLRVLHVASAFYPALYWGGPTLSLYHLCNHLAALPLVDLRVLASDTAGTGWADRVTREEASAAHYHGYEVHFCHKLWGVDFTPSLAVREWPMVAWADVVHLTSVYSMPTIPTLLAARLLRKPVVWSPRGSLQRWSGSTRVAAKHVWNRVCDALLVPRRSILHATSEEEAKESVQHIRNIHARVIPNGVEVPAHTPKRVWMPEDSLRILFLGRLDPKKGIDNLLRALQELRETKWILRICGDGKQAYKAKLESLVRDLQLGERVTFVGPVYGDAKTNELFASDLCVVPSYMENFNNVIAEAMAHGTPVIASRGTPWSEIENRGAGMWVDNTPSSLAAAIDRIRGMDLAAMGARGREWMLDEYAWHSVAERMLSVYRELTDHSTDRINTAPEIR